MAKKEQFGNSKSKVTVLLFQLEGDDQTIQTGMRTIQNALSGFGKQVKQIQSSPPDNSNVPEEEPLAETEDESNEDVSEIATSQRQSKSSRSFKMPKILDLDLTSGDVSLKAYCEQKSPGSTDTKKYLVIASWLKEYRQIEEVSCDHIHTCYRHMGWQTPKDASKPLRNMVYSNQWFSAGSSEGMYKINHIGENIILGMGKGK
ncbi:MAG TPA: hypothetical protein VFV23_13745 [Verrucomicrobiae bacterium]|nr:hypothetical protein [Verrucomicrobiae bacterium]